MDGIKAALVRHRQQRRPDPPFDFPGETLDNIKAALSRLRKQKYPHRPLHSSGDSFRLLYLQSGDLNDPIRIHVQTHSLANPPEYEALSYTWGASTRHRSIRLDNAAWFPVTDNLFAALRRLRRQRWDDRARILWVDALSVDQSNDEERSFQVSRMADIYRAASVVIVWLGDDEKNHRDPSGILNFEQSALLNAILHTRPSWCLWVAQEYANAAEVLFCFGAFGFRDVSLLATLHTEFPRVLAAADLYYTLLMLGMVRAELRGQLRRESRDFFSRLVPTIAMNVTEPRDRIYGILGLLNGVTAAHYTVDYSLSLVDIFSQATFAMMAESNFLVLLFAQCCPGQFQGLPTWAADLRNREQIRSKLKTSVSVVNEVNLPRGFESPSARQDRSLGRAQVTLSEDGRLLRIRGFELDRVTWVLSFENNNHGLLKRESLEAIAAAFRNLQGSTLFAPSRNDSRRRYLSLPKDADERMAVYQAGLTSVESAIANLNANVQQDILSHILADLLRLWRDLNCCPFESRLWPTDFQRPISQQLSNTVYTTPTLTFFTTADGLLGIGGQRVEVGDTIAFPRGACVPVVLHALQQDRYSFNGFCNVAYLEQILHYRFRNEDFIFLEEHDGDKPTLRKIKPKDVTGGDDIHQIVDAERPVLAEKEFVIC